MRLLPIFAGSVAITGTAAGVTAGVLGSATGPVSDRGTAAGTLKKATGSASGAVKTTGTAAGTLARIAGRATAASEISGSATASLEPLTGSSTGRVSVLGTASGTLGKVAGSAARAVEIAGSAEGTLAPIVGLATSATTPDDLVDAIVGLVRSTLVAGGSLTWFGTGRAPGWDEAQLPYALLLTFEEEAEYQSEDEDGSAPYDDRASVPITVFAGSASAAKSLARLVARTLTDAPLAFGDGELLYLRRATKASAPALDPDQTPDAGDCWSVSLIFAAITSKYT